MHHYLAMTWAPDDSQAAGVAPRICRMFEQSRGRDWKSLVMTDGLAVYSETSAPHPMCAYVLPGARGAILGRLFISGSVHRPATISDLPSARIVQTGGQWLVDNTWGRYVGIFRAEAGQCFVVRDCTGGIPCFYLRLSGVYLFFADVRDLEWLRPRLTLNEHYLAAFISRQPLHVRETGLNEITELLAGDRVTIAACGATQDSIWNPRAIVATATICNYPEFRARLIEVTERIVRSWAGLYSRILLSLSGGLDSAIVLGCLKHIGYAERVVCLTHYSAGTSSDERRYARSAAGMAGVNLIEVPLACDGAAFAHKLQCLPPDPRPDISKTNRILTLGTVNSLAEEFGCDTLWSGQGGDQIFLQRTHAYSAADYLRQHQMPWQLPRRVYEAAMLSRHSVWAVLLQALSYQFLKSKSPPVITGGCGDRFLAKPASIPEETIAGPWRFGNETLPPGKLDQLDLVHDLINRHKPLLGLEAPYEQHPLISQPLLELSLQIPTYHLLTGGRQRALARDAFRDRVPPCIISREDKGSTADQLRSLLRGSAPIIRESLLNGDLVSHGILDRNALEGILTHEETFAKNDLFPIFACIAAESWIQHWKTKPYQTAAA